MPRDPPSALSTPMPLIAEPLRALQRLISMGISGLIPNEARSYNKADDGIRLVIQYAWALYDESLGCGTIPPVPYRHCNSRILFCSHVQLFDHTITWISS